jgi:hypothetical protein
VCSQRASGGMTMAKPEEPYIELIVETYYESGAGLHGDIHVRSTARQHFLSIFAPASRAKHVMRTQSPPISRCGKAFRQRGRNRVHSHEPCLGLSNTVVLDLFIDPIASSKPGQWKGWPY